MIKEKKAIMELFLKKMIRDIKITKGEFIEVIESVYLDIESKKIKKTEIKKADNYESEEIWTISIKLTGGMYAKEDCKITLEIDSSVTLDVLANNILDVFEFDNDHMSEFFIARNLGYHSRDMVFVSPSPFAEDFFDEEEKYSTEDYSLTDLYPMRKNKYLFFHFDFGDDWHFKILKSRKKPKAKENGVHYPRVIKVEGNLPDQYPDWDEE